MQNPSSYTLYSFYQTNGAQTPSVDYFPLSGTGMATGVTSGAIADLLQGAPSLTPDKAKALVMVNGDRNYFPATSSVTDEGVVYNADYDVFTIGAGYLDILKTMNAALVNGGSVPLGTAMSPIATFNATTGDTNAVINPTALWGQTGPWSAASVYGNNAFLASDNSTSALWGKTALWGKEHARGAECTVG